VVSQVLRVEVMRLDDLTRTSVTGIFRLGIHPLLVTSNVVAHIICHLVKTTTVLWNSSMSRWGTKASPTAALSPSLPYRSAGVIIPQMEHFTTLSSRDYDLWG